MKTREVAPLVTFMKQVSHSEVVPLPCLPTGGRALVSRVLGHPDHVHRLEEFGVRRGIRIEMFRPGNPCIIRLAGNKVCLRADELLSVMVEPVA